ncbi:phosphoribosylglycinamide formyltransferase, partial [Desulfovibrio sp. OttesenSCG-928-G15]|nr:phosphoribosylglycinamide formyltransferase [Desulfovibrio sp. OttesenSCG-928-G15]
MTIQLAALASGEGTNIAAIIKSIESGRLEARMCLVLSNRPDAPVLDKARERGIPVWAKDHREAADKAQYDLEMVEAIKQAGADTIALAGYMRILSPEFIRAFPNRILNIHPAILPSFRGKTGAKDTIEYGARIAGATVHFVDEAVDHGPVIIQAAVPVGPNDTADSLMPRIHALEHRIYPQALQWFARNRLEIQGRKVHLKAGRFPSPKSATVNTGMPG